MRGDKETEEGKKKRKSHCDILSDWVPGVVVHICTIAFDEIFNHYITLHYISTAENMN